MSVRALYHRNCHAFFVKVLLQKQMVNSDFKFWDSFLSIVFHVHNFVSSISYALCLLVSGT